MWKRIHALTLALAMVISLLPMQIFAAGYTATMTADSTNGNPVRVGETLKVDLGVNDGYAATELTLTYDSDLVTFVESASTLGTADVVVQNGTVRLADYGADKAAAAANYVLAFTADAAGNAVFTLTKAAFGTGTSAVNADLQAATLPADLTIEIRPAQVDVTFSDALFYADSNKVEVGGTFAFYPESSTGGYYDYTLPIATMDGAAVTVTPTADGKGWQIEGVTGPITVNAGERTPKNFGAVVYEGTGATEATNKTANAVYLSDVTVTVPKNVAPGVEKGYEYTVSATVGDVTYTFDAPTVDADGNRTYTIPGTEVKGPVTVTVTKKELDPVKVQISIDGNAENDGDLGSGAGVSVQVDKSTGTATLTVDTTSGLKKGYIYTVTTNHGTLTKNDDGTYTITGVTEATTLNVNRVLNVEGAKNSVDYEGTINKSYVTLDGQEMWMIQLPNHVENTTTAVYTYDGAEMRWSADHNAYVTVVISETTPSIDVEKFGLKEVSATPTVAAVNWDVNKSGTVDANDAQLIWNMYSNVYQTFGEASGEATKEKFMLADANHDFVLDTKDAVVIIDMILGSN